MDNRFANVFVDYILSHFSKLYVAHTSNDRKSAVKICHIRKKLYCLIFRIAYVS